MEYSVEFVSPSTIFKPKKVTNNKNATVKVETEKYHETYY